MVSEYHGLFANVMFTAALISQANCVDGQNCTLLDSLLFTLYNYSVDLGNLNMVLFSLNSRFIKRKLAQNHFISYKT